MFFLDRMFYYYTIKNNKHTFMLQKPEIKGGIMARKCATPGKAATVAKTETKKTPAVSLQLCGEPILMRRSGSGGWTGHP